MIRGQVLPLFAVWWELACTLSYRAELSRPSIGKRDAFGYIHLPLSLPFSYALPHKS